MTGEPKPECRRACLRCGGLIPLWRERKSVFSPTTAMSWVLLQEAGGGARCSCSSAWRQPRATRPDSFMCQSRGTLFRSSELASGNMGLTNINALFPLRNQILRNSGLFGLSFTVINVYVDSSPSLWKSRGRLCFFATGQSFDCFSLVYYSLYIYIYIKLFIYT